MSDRIDEMNQDEQFEAWFAESVYATELKMPLRRAWHAALKSRPEVRPSKEALAWAIEELEAHNPGLAVYTDLPHAKLLAELRAYMNSGGT